MKKKRPVLDRRITIEIPTDSKDSVGTSTLTWATYYETAAHIDWERGDEKEMITRETAITKVKFIIRKSADYPLDAKMRISYDGVYYNILAILDDQYNKYLTIKTQEVE